MSCRHDLSEFQDVKPFELDDYESNKSQKKYNGLFENLVQEAEELLEEKENLQSSTDDLKMYGQDIINAASSGDASDIENAVSQIENEIYSFRSSVEDVSNCETNIESYVKEMEKLEKRYGFKTTLRKQVQKALKKELRRFE